MSKAYPWLPEKTSYGEGLCCRNCEHHVHPNCEDDRLGCARWENGMCGSWEEAKEIQEEIRLESND